MKAYVAVLLFALCQLIGTARAKVIAVEGGPGLPDKYITAICKDRRGLMWIATRQGLCTYDGSHFEAPISKVGAGIPINHLRYDPSHDVLWVASLKGLYRISCSNQFITLLSNKEAWGLGIVTDICVLTDGSVFASFHSGEIVHASLSGKMTLLGRVQHSENKQRFPDCVEPYDAGHLVFQFSGKGDWFLLSLKDGSFKQLEFQDKSVVLFRKRTSDTAFIDYLHRGLQIIDLKNSKDLLPSSSSLLSRLYGVTDACFCSDKSIYVVCKQARLYHAILDQNRIDTITSDIFNEKLATCLFYDPEGILWVGTNKGLLKVLENSHLFTPLLLQNPTVSVRSLAEDESGIIYAGTYSGFFRCLPRSQKWEKISTEIPYTMIDVPGSYIYYCTEQFGFYRLNKKNLRIESGFFTKGPLIQDESNRVYTMLEDSDGLIWIGTSAGLVTYNSVTNILSSYKTDGLPEGTQVANISHAKNGNLWLSTLQGVYELNPLKGIVWHISNQTQPALAVNTVNYVSEDSIGRLWICTVGGGINMLSQDRRQVTVLKTSSGLSDNETYQLIWQDNKRAWISTFNGLSSYNPQTQAFYNYFLEDGLTSNEFNHNAFLQDRTGRLLFGTIRGISSFFPDSVFEHESATGLFVSGITKWDNKTHSFVNLNPADSISPIVLNPLDHSLAFNLALTNYNNPEACNFQYRIKGLFDDWVSLSGQHTLRLDGLAPGSYILELKATDSRGTPALNRLQYHIRVGQLFFKSWWFYLLLFLISSLLLAAFFVLRLQNIKRVQSLREQIASDLHDEVGSLLTRITMTSDNLRNTRNTEADKSSKLQKIASLSRTAASSMSDILWAIDARNDYTGNLADRMREHGEEMLSAIGLHPHFDFKVNQRLSIPSQFRQQLYLIYKEAINNIVKHSTATEVNISYHHTEQGFYLSIVNDGYQEKEGSNSRGQGIRNMYMRASKLHATAQVGAQGNEFSVIIKN